MAKILNYESSETLATGFVRPKVTSLFFDKIWIPQSLLDMIFEYSAIPNEVLVREKDELRINKSTSSQPAGFTYKRALESNARSGAWGIESGDLYRINTYYNRRESSNNMNDIWKTSNSPVTIDLSYYKYSKNRNQAILLCSENFCRQYGIHIAPVYHDLTAFEREAQSLKNSQLYNHKSLFYRLRNPNVLKNANAFSICIQDFPSIKEDELSWEHVMDIRKDKRRMRQLQRFTNWTNSKLKDKSPDEIREILESELDEYRAAIKELGIKTSIGSFSTLISELNPMVSLFSNPQSIMPWISMVAIPLPFVTDIYLANMKNRKNPIAYLYDIQNKD